MGDDDDRLDRAAAELARITDGLPPAPERMGGGRRYELIAHPFVIDAIAPGAGLGQAGDAICGEFGRIIVTPNRAYQPGEWQLFADGARIRRGRLGWSRHHLPDGFNPDETLAEMRRLLVTITTEHARGPARRLIEMAEDLDAYMSAGLGPVPRAWDCPWRPQPAP